MKKLKILFTLVFTFLILLLGVSCNSSNNTNNIQTKNDVETSKLKIMTTLFPTYDFAKHIVKDKGEVTLIMGPGVEPHSYDPTPKDIVSIEESNIFIFTGKEMEPWTKQIIENNNNKLLIVDVSEGLDLIKDSHHHHHEQEDNNHEHMHFHNIKEHYHPNDTLSIEAHSHKDEVDSFTWYIKSNNSDDFKIIENQNSDTLNYTISNNDNNAIIKVEALDKNKNIIESCETKIEVIDHHKDHHHHGEFDPHIWTSPLNAIKMVDNILNAIIKIDPENKDYYIKNANEYKYELQKLNDDIKNTFKDKDFTIVYGGHFALAYFARDYHLNFVAAYDGFSPDAEPSPKDIANLKDLVNEKHIKAIYHEELIKPNVANAIAEGTNIKVLELSGIHTVSADEFKNGVTYIDIMRRNLENLKQGF